MSSEGRRRVSPPLPVSPEQLTGLLEDQLRLYESLRALAVEQRALLAGGDASALLALLARRQRLVDALGRLDSALRPVREQWEAVVADLDEAQRQRVGDLVRRVEGLAREILERDREDAARLSEARDRVAAAMGEVSRGQQALKTYAQHLNAARFVNVTDEGAS